MSQGSLAGGQGVLCLRAVWLAGKDSTLTGEQNEYMN